MNIDWTVAAPAGLLIIAILGGGFGLLKISFNVGKLHSDVTDMKNQMKPDHGPSFKDDMNTVKGDVRDLNTKFDAHLAQHSGLWR